MVPVDVPVEKGLVSVVEGVPMLGQLFLYNRFVRQIPVKVFAKLVQ